MLWCVYVCENPDLNTGQGEAARLGTGAQEAEKLERGAGQLAEERQV